MVTKKSWEKAKILDKRARGQIMIYRTEQNRTEQNRTEQNRSAFYAVVVLILTNLK